METSDTRQKPGAGCGCLAPLTAAVVAAGLSWLVVGASWTWAGLAAAVAAAFAGLFMVIGESAIEDVVKTGLLWIVGVALMVKGSGLVDALGLALVVGPVMGSLGNWVVEGARRRDAAMLGEGAGSARGVASIPTESGVGSRDRRQ